MTKPRIVSTIAFVLLAPALASAEPDYERPDDQPADQTKRSEFEAGLFCAGLGVGVPMGTAMKSTDGASLAMNDVVSAEIPLSLGLGYRFGAITYFGVAFQYAFLTTKNCDTGSSCSASWCLASRSDTSTSAFPSRG